MLVTLGFKGEKKVHFGDLRAPCSYSVRNRVQEKDFTREFFLSLGVPFQVANKMKNESQYWERVASEVILGILSRFFVSLFATTHKWIVVLLTQARSMIKTSLKLCEPLLFS